MPWICDATLIFRVTRNYPFNSKNTGKQQNEKRILHAYKEFLKKNSLAFQGSDVSKPANSLIRNLPIRRTKSVTARELRAEYRDGSLSIFAQIPISKLFREVGNGPLLDQF